MQNQKMWIIFLCLAVLTFRHSLSQVIREDDFQLGGRIGDPDLNYYGGLFDPQRNVLELSPEALLNANALIQATLDQFNPLRTDEQRHEFMKQVTKDFSEEQLSLFQQCLRMRYYRGNVGKYYRELGSYDYRFYWMHPDLAELLEVDNRQIEQVVNSCSRIAELKKDYNERRRAQFEDLLSQWQTRLEDVLLPGQDSFYREATGADFEFASDAKGIFRYVSGPLCLQKSKVRGVFQGGITPLHMLLVGQQRLDGEMNFHAATHLLQSETLQTELELGESQLRQIKRLEEAYVAEHPLPNRLVYGFRERGVPYVHDENEESTKDTADEDAKNEENMISEADDAEAKARNKELHRRLIAVLDAKQQARWKQIQNQIVLQFGWRQVPLTFPDWPSYLEFSRKQTEEFERIHLDMETQFDQAEVALEEQLRSEQQNVDKLDVLTPQQKAKLILLFGKFSGFEVPDERL